MSNSTPNNRMSLAGVAGVAGPVITALIAIAGWVFSVSETTAVNAKAIDSIEKKAEKSYEKLHSSIRDLQENQRRDMGEIREELRYLNSRIDTVIEKKPYTRPALYAEM